MQSFDARSFARHGIITAVFSCTIALALTLTQQGAWDTQLVYSLAIGLVSWLVIDLGRLPLAPADGRGWPQGWRGLLLIAVGIACGYVLGSLLGDAYSGQPQALWPQQGVATSLVITVLAGAAISFFFYSHSKAQYLQLHMAQAQRDAAQARLALLQAQLEPHMLFNTLANLRVLVASDPVRAQAMLDHLIAYLRATLGASRAALHPLADEFERVHDYLALIAIRMGSRLQYQLDLPQELRSALVPTLILQPLVENAIRHGLEPQVAGGAVTVRARTTPGSTPAMLVLEVYDTGAGLATPPPAAPTGSHFGLTQVRERLGTLYGNLGAINLIAASAHETCARAQFPLNFPDHTAPEQG